MLLSFLQKYNTVMSITVISRKNYSLQENLTAEFVRGYLVLTQGRSGWRKKESHSCGTSPSARNLPLAKAVMILVLSRLYPCLPQQNYTLHTVTPAYLLTKHTKRRNRPLAFYSPHLQITVIFLSIPLKIYPEIFSVNQPTLNTSYSKNMKAVSSDILIVYSNPVLD